MSFLCSECGKMFWPAENTYIGPSKLGDTRCDPLIDFIYLCSTCAPQSGYTKEALDALGGDSPGECPIPFSDLPEV